MAFYVFCHAGADESTTTPQGRSEEGSIAITRRDETVAYLVSRERMEAIAETLELLGNADAMKAISDYERGKTRFLPLAALDAG
jgi:antitoxin YefM